MKFVPAPSFRNPPPPRPVSQCLLALSFSLAAFWWVSPAVAATPEVQRTSVYSQSTVIVYNTNVAASKELAQFYAEARKIPSGNIVALTCPDKETITRTEFEETIAKPLRDAFVGNRWWSVSLDTSEGVQVQANRIHIIALMYGIPLRVENDLPPPAAQTDPKTGKPIPRKPDPQATSACSVDSELCMLAKYSYERAGPLRNPYYEKSVNLYQARIPGFMLVGRIDGPTPEIARRLITDAIAAEKDGLWGMAYVDVAKKIKEGDEWLMRSAETFERGGIPVVLDRWRARFRLNYPMRNASLYFGWYATDVDGPFVNPGFTFRRGAVACHLHSFSGRTLRSTSAAWVGPLLARGAAAVLGNVYEPYLNLTHHFDIFNDRLLEGFTFIESAYMAAPGISWMSVAVGDPLYRPFEAHNQFDTENYRKDENREFKAFRLATLRWQNDDPLALRDNLEKAAAALQSGLIYEGMALKALRDEKHEKAEAFLQKAFDTYSEKEDRLRVRLHQADLARIHENKEAAVAILQKAVVTYSGLPEAEAALSLLTELKPPLPPLPPPPGAQSSR